MAFYLAKSNINKRGVVGGGEGGSGVAERGELVAHNARYNLHLAERQQLQLSFDLSQRLIRAGHG